ncbi:MAG: hypothetical protein AB7I33_16020 [Gemmatimonadales bacterium]
MRNVPGLSLPVGICLLVLGHVGSAGAQVTADSTRRMHNAAAVAAYRQQDWGEARRHLEALAGIMHGNPRITVGIASVAARQGDTGAALAALERFAGMGLVQDLAGDDDLASLRDTPRFAKILERVAENAKPVRRGDTAFTLPEADAVIEDLAFDPADGSWYFTSIRKGGVLRRDNQGNWSHFVAPGADESWATSALALDPATRTLWVSTVAIPHYTALEQTDAGRTAVLGYDLASGRLVRRVEMPRDAAPHWLGDMSLAPDGTLYVSDSRSGGIYRLARGDSSFQVLLPAGELPSPQGLVPMIDGHRLLVADYVRGIAVIDRGTGALSWLPAAPGVALAGIDGLSLAGNTLIAVQNGTRPNRVVQFHLTPGLDSITGWSPIESGTPGLVEPTHGRVHAGTFWFIANSGWDALTDDGSLRQGAAMAKPVVLKVRVKNREK